VAVMTDAARAAPEGDARGSAEAKPETPAWKRAAAGLAVAAALGGGVHDASAGVLTRDEFGSRTYDEIVGSGLANTCPNVKDRLTDKVLKGSIPLAENLKYKVKEFCMEPTEFAVSQEVQAKKEGGLVTVEVPGKVMTRKTYVLTGMEGSIFPAADGQLVFKEDDEGINYAPTTVQLPGGERVPFLFTTKQLEAKSTGQKGVVAVGDIFAGKFSVPSYRTGLFLDPKGRGGTTGYDQAVALPGMQANGAGVREEIAKETDKVYQTLPGSLQLSVNEVNQAEGEIGGTFIHRQPSDTDMGSKEPKEIILRGNWIATIDQEP